MATIAVDGAHVHYEKTGSGPALALVHGTGSAGAALNWGQIAPRFAAHRTVIAPDLSGAGATVDDGGPLTVERLAAQVVAVIEEAVDGPVDLLGFSMGATVTAAVAALRPDLVRRLALAAGWAHTDGDEYLRSLFTLWQELGDAAPASFGRALAMTGFSRGFLNTIGRDQFEALMPNMPPTEGTLRHIAYDLTVDIRELLPRIQAPTLVIGATQDITVPVEHSRALHAAIPGSSYAEIDAGHVMLFEQEDLFVKLVTDFIEAPAAPEA
ncbi:alpha/beta fold hydrolase [Streptomyces sp. MUM 178J]|uniref:alpha/beta fold hydrolase n=1 Tax=Streptomyces sp. MUM 178J TaxID=2791991 RepID=UPI001F043EDB|nr:alpha/beta hydrolase [Streptomyces sp. MUM 178J]WRQ82986.1 alpha/beta hydrolase [Streptomyces sp. MUM 178J]